MKCNFNNADLENNLDRTICRYAGVPVIVSCEGGNNLILYRLDNAAGDPFARIKSTDDDFDISTPPLGYAQWNQESVIYVSRLPVRKWKQGLSLENTKAVALPRGNADPQNVPFDFRHKAISNMMQSIYPDFKSVLKQLKKADLPIEIAVSNNCALKKIITRRTVNVYYKNELVGFIPEIELESLRPKVIVPNSLLGKIISLYLHHFDWEVN